MPDASRRQLLSAKAAEERARSSDWLLRFIIAGQPKRWTKSELCQAAMRELQVSKSSFNFAWVNEIERTGRRDWYEPLRTRQQSKPTRRQDRGT
jgi:hypothetical protein